MNDINLTPSAVIFNEENHTYADATGKRYSGITSLIHSILRLGVYPDADEWVQQIAIPRAGYYGSCVHKAIQTYDTIGLELTDYPENVVQTKDFGAQTFPGHDVSKELQAYIDLRGEREAIASEFTVSYGDYASQIDSVWLDGDRIILVDFKTNNLPNYPGGKAGLIDYLSWQLSCYAFMFKEQTGLDADIMGMHIRDGKAELWPIPMQPFDKVKQLLETECILTDNGFVYFNPDMQVTDTSLTTTAASTITVPAEITTAIANLLEAEKKAKEMKAKLRELMEENGVIKWECDLFTASITKDSNTNTFDEKAFQADHPELYAQYVFPKPRKGAFKIKAK